jgi:hypothetical protein
LLLLGTNVMVFCGPLGLNLKLPASIADGARERIDSTTLGVIVVLGVPIAARSRTCFPPIVIPDILASAADGDDGGDGNAASKGGVLARGLLGALDDDDRGLLGRLSEGGELVAGDVAGEPITPKGLCRGKGADSMGSDAEAKLPGLAEPPMPGGDPIAPNGLCRGAGRVTIGSDADAKPASPLGVPEPEFDMILFLY